MDLDPGGPKTFGSGGSGFGSGSATLPFMFEDEAGKRKFGPFLIKIGIQNSDPV
jgi:hypothetical protein